MHLIACSCAYRGCPGNTMAGKDPVLPYIRYLCNTEQRLCARDSPLSTTRTRDLFCPCISKGTWQYLASLGALPFLQV